MNILFVGLLPPRQGGSCIVGAELLNGLARQGHRCRAFAPLLPEWGDDTSPLIEHANLQVSHFLVPRFAETHDAFFRSADLQEVQRVTTVPKVLAAIEDDRPDAIILCNESFAYHIPELALARGIPILQIAHSGNLPGAVRGGAFSEADSRALIENMRRVSCIVAVASHMTAAWRQLGFANVWTIPNAVDDKVFSPAAKKAELLASLNIADSDIVVLHLSNMKPVKRIGDLIASAASALRSNPNLLYVIGGDGPQRRELEQACQQQRIAERFRFPGWVTHAHVAEYLNLADMVVMPSASEGLSLAMLEAQACAKPLLASDNAGARELIRHGETGLLYPVGDVSELTQQILRAAADPQLRAALGSRARQEAEGRSLQTMIAAYEAILRTLIGASGHHS